MINSRLKLKNNDLNHEKIALCKEFIKNTVRPKYLFGRNMYAAKIIQHIDIDGFIDDFTDDTHYQGKPIIKIDKIPSNALVLILSGGRPLSAEKRIKNIGLDCLDYFAFYKHSGLPLDEIHFMEGFDNDFTTNRKQYDWIYDKFEDTISKNQFKKLLEFKTSYELNCLKGFKHLEDEQYFEDFLELSPEGEVFADVGSYDGYTSEAFINICPTFSKIHVFEPIPKNMDVVKEKLDQFHDIFFHPVGLSDKQQTVQFSVGGSTSTANASGSETVQMDTMDNLVDGKVTFIKMDIEGAELEAIDGAKETIAKYHPKLAISVYHRPSDIWEIPKKILSIYDGYKIYLRHYTESVYETVMFFIPKNPLS